MLSDKIISIVNFIFTCLVTYASAAVGIALIAIEIY